MKHVFLTLLLLVVIRLAVGPLTISEHKDRNEANGATPRIGQPFDIIGQVALVCDEHPRRITLIDRDHPVSLCILDPNPTANYRDGVLASVVRDASNAEWNWLLLRTNTGLVRAAATEKGYPFATLHALLDADVQLRGIITKPDIRLKSRGNHLILYGSNGLLVIQPPPAPFSTPLFCDTAISHRQQTLFGDCPRMLKVSRM